jgi:hypothetical protein
MSPPPNPLRLVTDPSGEPRLSGDVCRVTGCAATAVALGFCPLCLERYRRRLAQRTQERRSLALRLERELRAAAPLLFASLSEPSKRALGAAAVDVIIGRTPAEDLVSRALVELLSAPFDTFGAPSDRRRRASNGDTSRVAASCRISPSGPADAFASRSPSPDGPLHTPRPHPDLRLV